MLPTLYIGDYLVVAKWPYGYSRYSFPFGIPAVRRAAILEQLPQRGDVVVFRHPSENADLIKRVIGLPGDTVEVRGGPADPQRPPRAAAAARARTRCRSAPTARARSFRRRRRSVVAADGQAVLRCIQPIRETLPGGPSYTVLDQVDDGPADDFAAGRACPPAMSS